MYKDIILYARSYAKVFALFCILSVSALWSEQVIAQSCQSDFKVEKNRQYRSADADGTTYWMLLTNLSAVPKTYSIETSNLSTSCENNIHPASGPNVSLNLAILDESSNPVGNQVLVSPGQTFRFQIKVTVPDGTPVERWSCVEVLANTNNCVNPLKANLSIYVPDSSEE